VSTRDVPPISAEAWARAAGFNGGSGVAASSRDAFALVNSTLAASFAMFTWMLIEWAHAGKPQLVGACVGAVGGFATITPAAGYVLPWSAMVIGFLCAPFCFGCVMVRNALGWDDALDVWGVHGMGGLLGSILIGPFANASVGGVGPSGMLFGKQLAACCFTLVYALVLSYLLLRVINVFLPLVPPADIVAAGLDKTIHGEHAYDSDHIVQSGLQVGAGDSFYVPADTAAALSDRLSAETKLAAVHPEGEVVALRRDLNALMEVVMELREMKRPGTAVYALCTPGPATLTQPDVKPISARGPGTPGRKSAWAAEDGDGGPGSAREQASHIEMHTVRNP
jgi:hypothetical protein